MSPYFPPQASLAKLQSGVAAKKEWEGRGLAGRQPAHFDADWYRGILLVPSAVKTKASLSICINGK